MDYIKTVTENQASEYVLGLAKSGEPEGLDVGMALEMFTRDCAHKLSAEELQPWLQFAGYQFG